MHAERLVMPQVSFRDATLEDLPQIVEIYNSTVASRMVTADTEPVSVESKVKWFNEHSPDKRPLWVLEDADNQMVGWASFQSFYGRPAYHATVEVSIYLAPSARGCGIGKLALQHCIDAAPRFGIKTILGIIFSHNIPSINLFHQFGFKDWGQFPNIAILDGVERSVTVVGKRLH